MAPRKTLGESLREHGVSQRGFLKFCAATASMMALPPSMVPAIAAALEQARRPSVIWLSFQECTGCTESLTRSFSPTVEDLILDVISLDYHHTLQAASGHQAEAARDQGGDEGGPHVVASGLRHLLDGVVRRLEGLVEHALQVLAGLLVDRVVLPAARGQYARRGGDEKHLQPFVHDVISYAKPVGWGP